MDIRGLQYFISAAECLNFTRAARECFITQTAMSLHIAKMEKELGFQLFSRKNHVVKLTPAGKDFYTRALRIVRSYEEAVQHGLDTASGNESGASIIVPSSFEGLAIMPALRKFRQMRANNNISVRIVESRAIPEALRQGEADLAVSWPHDVSDDTAFETVDIIKSPCCAVISENNPLAEFEKIPAEVIQDERVIVLDPQGTPTTYREMRSRFDRAGFIPGSKISAKTAEDVILAVASDEAIGILPGFMAQFAPPGIVFRNFDASEQDLVMATISLIYIGDEVNIAVRELIDTIISHFHGFSHSAAAVDEDDFIVGQTHEKTERHAARPKGKPGL